MSILVGITLSVVATESAAAVFLCLEAILCVCSNWFLNHYE